MNIKGIFLLLLVLVLPRLLIAQNDNPLIGYSLVWQDEFNIDKIDTNKWSFDTEADPNWNGEQQYYTTRKENCYLNKGKLYIVAKHEKYTFNNETREYTSEKLRTKGKANWQYGKIIVRAKLPTAGNGLWPAIWMMPSTNKYGNWPRSGEIDIMEFVGHLPNIIHGTVHTKAYNHIDGTQKGSTIHLSDISSKFHNYSVEWDKEFIKFAVDDSIYFKFANEHKSWEEWPFDQKFYLILNLAIGGSWGGEKGIDNKVFPAIMEIDYVRVYQKDK